MRPVWALPRRRRPAVRALRVRRRDGGRRVRRLSPDNCALAGEAGCVDEAGRRGRPRRRRACRVSRRQAGRAAAPSRVDVGCARRGRARAHRGPSAAGDDGVGRHRRRPLAGGARARPEPRGDHGDPRRRRARRSWSVRRPAAAAPASCSTSSATARPRPTGSRCSSAADATSRSATAGGSRSTPPISWSGELTVVGSLVGTIRELGELVALAERSGVRVTTRRTRSRRSRPR